MIIVFPIFRIGELLEVFRSLDEAEKEKEKAEKREEDEQERSGSPEAREGSESPPPSPTGSNVTPINTVRQRWVCFRRCMGDGLV